MDPIKKAGTAGRPDEIREETLRKINLQALTPLTAEQVYTFKINACDDQIDRDHECFDVQALKDFAVLFIGKTGIFDHSWSAGQQTARVYDASVVEDGGVNRLQLYCYMLRSEKTADIIDAINGGILREVSVGVSVKEAVCSVCGQPYHCCGHAKGETYDGKECFVILRGAVDAYEWSFVAVPAQKEAGVTKSADAVLLKPDREAAGDDKAKEAYSARDRRIALYEKMVKI